MPILGSIAFDNLLGDASSWRVARFQFLGPPEQMQIGYLFKFSGSGVTGALPADDAQVAGVIIDLPDSEWLSVAVALSGTFDRNQIRYADGSQPLSPAAREQLRVRGIFLTGAVPIGDDAGTEPLPPAEPIEDSWPIEHKNDDGSYGLYGRKIGVSMSFRAKLGGVLDRAKVWMKRSEPPQDPPILLTCHIYETSMPIATATPEGASLAASEPVDSSTLAPMVGDPVCEPVEFVFTGANKIQLVKDKVYCLVISRPTPLPEVILDAYRFGFDNELKPPRGDAAEGNYSDQREDGVWAVSYATWGLIFYVYSDKVGGTQPPTGPELVDSCEEQNDINSYALNGTRAPPDTVAIYQAFTAPKDMTVHSFKVSLRKEGAPVGNLMMWLYDTTGSYPTAVPVPGSGRQSKFFDVANVTTDPNGSLCEFLFYDAVPIQLTAGQVYAIAVEISPSLSLPDPAKVYAGFNFDFEGAGGAGHYGNGGYYNGVWNADDMGDMVFYLYAK